MRKSTFSNINCDEWLSLGKISFKTKVFYLLRNWVNNNWFPNNADNDLIIRNFVCDISDVDWNQLKIKSTPGRILSDLFWLKLPWKRVISELTSINIFDTGCGPGHYGIKLQADSDSSISSYVGIDSHYYENWDNLLLKYKNIRFYQLDSTNIIDYIPRTTNLFITQSAIEHFDEDLHFFEQIRDFILMTSNNVIQIHLFPSSAQLKLGLFHGIRQYTLRTISKITRIFNDFSYSVLFGLGGNECNSLHWNFITKPRLARIGDLRETKTNEYNKRLINAIRNDMNKHQKYPTFYALVIHSNWKEKIFLP
jgi:SAM-dependent methyltransferase